ncbi:unnamed protein product, partial [Chrysoparadoxa australica]
MEADAANATSLLLLMSRPLFVPRGLTMPSLAAQWHCKERHTCKQGKVDPAREMFPARQGLGGFSDSCPEVQQQLMCRAERVKCTLTSHEAVGVGKVLEQWRSQGRNVFILCGGSDRCFETLVRVTGSTQKEKPQAPPRSSCIVQACVAPSSHSGTPPEEIPTRPARAGDFTLHHRPLQGLPLPAVMTFRLPQEVGMRELPPPPS